MSNRLTPGSHQVVGQSHVTAIIHIRSDPEWKTHIRALGFTGVPAGLRSGRISLDILRVHTFQPMYQTRTMSQALYDKYYPKPRFEGGTLPFYRVCRENILPRSRILEIGAGPTNECSQMLSGIGEVTGIDIDPDVKNNGFLSRSVVYDGRKMPFDDETFDACVSNWVLEHVEHPIDHFREVARVLRPEGVYCLRTPNLFHYVSIAARLLPHSMHLMLANRLRGLDDDAHAPYPTWFRSNTRRKLEKLCHMAGLNKPAIVMLEPEPAYGNVHPILFYPFMAYERLVNSSSIFEGMRITILLAARKPAGPQDN